VSSILLKLHSSNKAGTSPLYYSSLAGVVGGAKVVPLRGVGPHSHPLTESSKGGPGRARPRLIAGLPSPWEVCDAKGLIEVLAVGPV